MIHFFFLQTAAGRRRNSTTHPVRRLVYLCFEPTNQRQPFKFQGDKQIRRRREVLDLGKSYATCEIIMLNYKIHKNNKKIPDSLL